VTSDDLWTYKKILLLTNAHLKGYQPGGVINVSRWKKYREIIAPLFARPKGRGFESGLRRAWKKILRCPPGHYITIRPNRQLSRQFTSSLQCYLGKTNRISELSWNTRKHTLCISLSGNDSCAIPIMSNLMYAWECDLLNLQSLRKYDMHRYILL